MATEIPDYECAVCVESGIKLFWVGIEDDNEWRLWCDSCITKDVSKLTMIVIHPTDFLKIPPEDLAHPFYAGVSG